jgi:hypothetical protein
MTAQLYGTEEARVWPIRADGSAPRHHRRRPAMQFVLKSACAGRSRAGTGQPGRSDPRLAHSPRGCDHQGSAVTTAGRLRWTAGGSSTTFTAEIVVMMTLCASGRRVHVVADVSTCTADMQRPQRSEDDVVINFRLRHRCKKLSFTGCHRGDFVTFDAECRVLSGARVCSSGMRDEHDEPWKRVQRFQSRVEACRSSPEGSSHSSATMAARIAIATAGASSPGNASPNRATAATRATSAVAKTASRRDADRERSASSVAVDAAVGDVAAVAWLSVSAVVDGVMVFSLRMVQGLVPRCFYGCAEALPAPSVDRPISGLNRVSSYRRGSGSDRAPRFLAGPVSCGSDHRGV